jgi:hypothetical protein
MVYHIGFSGMLLTRVTEEVQVNEPGIGLAL